jgi:hypothetical protein
MSNEEQARIREEIISVLRDHLSIRIEQGPEYTSGGDKNRIRVSLFLTGPIHEGDTLISSDFIVMPEK